MAEMSDMITMTIGQMVESQARMHPDNDGLIAPLIGVRYTYRQFNEECDTIAKAFLAMGIKKGRSYRNLVHKLPAMGDHPSSRLQDWGSAGDG